MFKPALARWVATRRSRQLLLSLLPAICALLLLIGLGCYLLVKNALSQDADVQQRSRTFVNRTIDQVRNEVGLNIMNYSKWGEAYKNLHMTVDKAWADEQRNVGSIPYDLYGYDGVLVLDPQDRTVYTVLEGKASTLQASDWLQGDLPALLASVRAAGRDDKSETRAFRVNGTAALVAASTITPGWDPSISVTPGPASVMFFVLILDSARLAHLSETYGLPPLTVAQQPLPGQESMQLPHSDVYLNWIPPQPGTHLLRQTLPLFIAGVLALAGVLTVLLRHSMASARQIDAQFDALLASQAELTGSEQRFRDIAEASSDWLWEVDAQGCLTYLSGRFSQVTGARRNDWIGQPLANLLRPQDGSLQHWLTQPRHDTDDRDTLACHYLDQAGHLRICTITSRAMAQGRGYRGTATDITDEVQAQAEVRHLSRHDFLTGLPNRYQLDQFLASHLDRPAPQPLAVLSLDLDRFKPVNDTLGHAAGDEVLKEVARRLQGMTPAEGMVARVGGDEFIVAVPALIAQTTFEHFCAQAVEALCRPFEVHGKQAFLGTSIGIALAPLHACTATELLRMSDVALYQAKSAGRNTWRVYSEAMDASQQQRRHLEEELREALHCGQLRVHYQPRYATLDGALRGFEALVRWQHPQQGLLLPDTFIPLAEDTGLIQPLGRWVLEQACRDAMTWPDSIGLSVNLSPGQFGESQDVPAMISQALQDSGLPARRLELEITERMLLRHTWSALETLRSIKALGVRLSLDDFGTGFSSLAYLRSYPLDGIKIDRSFIVNLTTHDSDLAIVQAMIELGRALGITVTAEGIDTVQQLDCLRRHACDEVQGFHFSQALPADQLLPLLAAAQVNKPI